MRHFVFPECGSHKARPPSKAARKTLPSAAGARLPKSQADQVGKDPTPSSPPLPPVEPLSLPLPHVEPSSPNRTVLPGNTRVNRQSKMHLNACPELSPSFVVSLRARKAIDTNHRMIEQP